jgi:hypothetical protein
MADHSAKLSECRFLVVEDEPVVALDVADALEREGTDVAGPAGTVAAEPLVRGLGELEIPFVFVTGYATLSLPRFTSSTAQSISECATSRRDEGVSPSWRIHPIVQKPMVAAELVDALAYICTS